MFSCLTNPVRLMFYRLFISVAAISTIAANAQPTTNMTGDQEVLLALQNARDVGFNTYLTNSGSSEGSGSPGGLWVNWRWTSNPPVNQNNGNINSSGVPDPDPTTRHDRLTDLEYVAAMVLYKQRFPTDTQFDAEMIRYTNILNSPANDEFLTHPDERGWTYWSQKIIQSRFPAWVANVNAQADKSYNQFVKNLTVNNYPGVTPLFLNFTDPTGNYTTANEVEDACVLICNGEERGLTNYVAAGEALLAYLKPQAYNTNLHIFCKQLAHVFTDSTKTSITLPGNQTLYDPVIKPGELGEICDALIYAEQADPGHGYGAWAREVLDRMQPSVNTYGLWDSQYGGYWSQDKFTPTNVTIGSLSLSYVLSTGYKEVGRYTVVERAFVHANQAGIATYSSNTLATIHQAGIAAYYIGGHGWTYQANGNFTRYQGNDWVTSEAIGHACRSILTYEFALTNLFAPDFSLATSPGAQSANAGSSTIYTNIVSALNGFTNTVAFSISGLPAGASGSFNPAAVAGSGTAMLTVTTSSSTPTGTNMVTITGTGNSLIYSNTVTLIVNAAPGVLSFGSMTLNGSNLVISGANGTPSGAYYVLNSTNLALPLLYWTIIATNQCDSGGSFNFTNTINPATPRQFFDISMAPPDFGISAAPASQTVTAGNATTFTNYVSAMNGFSGTVTFAVSGLPGGVNGSFGPASVNASGTSMLTLTTSSSTPAGTNIVVITGTSGSLVYTNTVTLVVNAAGGGGVLPVGWTDVDIGTPSVPGSADYANGTWTVIGDGSDINNSSDQFNYAYEAASGANITNIVRVVSVQNTASGCKGGVMFRETTTAGSINVDLCYEPGKGVAFLYRPTTGGTTTKKSNPAASTPIWLKLVRAGNNFLGYMSTDGAAWVSVDSQTVAMATNNITAGLAVTSHLNGTLGTSVFDNVNFP